MKHLILGSAGQVGAYLTEQIVRDGDEVIQWDIEISPDHDLTKEFVTKKYLTPKIEECDFVHFLAFDVGGSKYLEKYQDTYQFVENNINLMRNTFDLLQQTKKPFYFASSQMSNMFHSTYGRLKAIGESYTNSLKGINIRFWNVYGYETNPEKTHVITDFIRMALNDGGITMRTTGVEERNFLYGNDAAKLLIGLAKNQIDGSIYSVDKNPIFQSILNYGAIPILSSQPFISMLKLAELIAEIIDPNIGIYVNAKKIDSVQGKKNEINRSFIDNLNQYLGLEHETSLQDGIRQIVEREKSNGSK